MRGLAVPGRARRTASPGVYRETCFSRVSVVHFFTWRQGWKHRISPFVLIYAHDRSAGEKHLRARELITGLWESGVGCLSIQVLQEFYVNATQKIAKPLTPEAAAQIIADLSVWQVHRPGVEDVLDAIRLQSRYQIPFWDAMIIASAMQSGCQTIWSEDLNPGQTYDQVKVLSPF